MHRRMIAAVAALLVAASIGLVGVGAVAAQDSQADATISEQTSGGHTVVVDEVTLPDGGFVTIHDSTLNDGGEAVLTSVRGSSAYLEAGTHENVTVHLDAPLEEDASLVAMPHRDTDGDRSYSFVSSGGQNDGPYTDMDDEIVVDGADVTVSATVSMSDQPTDGSAVLVDRVELSEDGFVTIHDGSLLDGAVLDSVRGTSEYLEAGEHSDVEVSLEDPYEEDGTAIAMPHRDTNANEAYDFVESEGSADDPYTDGGDAVVADAALTVEASDDGGMNADGGNTDGDGAGFGAVAVLVATLAGVMAVRRLN